MANIGGKRIALTLEFYLRGNKKIPSVAFIGSEDYGVPMTPHTRGDAENAAFDEFSKAAYKFCSQMAKAGAFKR